MRRLLLLAGALASSVACSTLSTLEGARTLDKGQTQVAFAVSAQRGANPIGAALPLPQVEVAGRFGLADDVDLGVRAYLLGAGFDVRYRFYHRDRLHLAVAPGLSGFWLPLIGGPAGQGSAELRAPLFLEYELSPRFSVAGGPRVILRDTWNSVTLPGADSGLSSRLDAYAGAGARGELHLKRLTLGLSGDLYGQPARHAGPSWSAGVDVGFRSAPRPRE